MEKRRRGVNKQVGAAGERVRRAERRWATGNLPWLQMSAGAPPALKFMLCSWRKNSVMPLVESNVLSGGFSSHLIEFVIDGDLTTDLGEDERNSDGFKKKNIS